MKFLERLRQEDSSSEVAYHLEGLIEAQENVRARLEELDSDLGGEPFAVALSKLQVEIYSHLYYHLKELRSPFKTFVNKAYQGLPELDEEAEVARLQAMGVNDRTEPSG